MNQQKGERRKTEGRAKHQKERQKRLQPLRVTKARYEKDISNLLHDITRHEETLEYIEERYKEDLRIDKEQKSSWTYLGSFVQTKAKEVDKQKQARSNDQLQRSPSHRLKGNLLDRSKGKLQRQLGEQQKVIYNIFAEEDRV